MAAPFEVNFFFLGERNIGLASILEDAGVANKKGEEPERVTTVFAKSSVERRRLQLDFTVSFFGQWNESFPRQSRVVNP